MRNIELVVQRASLKREVLGAVGVGVEDFASEGTPSGLMATASFSNADIEALLAQFGLDDETPLSALAIELSLSQTHLSTIRCVASSAKSDPAHLATDDDRGRLLLKGAARIERSSTLLGRSA